MKPSFFADGIRFECQETGRCCMSRGTYGYVYMSEKEARGMARELGQSFQEFQDNYCEKTDDGVYYLRHPEQDCVFLDGKHCGVYKVRPSQCRNWPFWPENMNAKTWNTEVTTFCPGIGKGKLYSESEIQKILKEDLFYEKENEE